MADQDSDSQSTPPVISPAGLPDPNRNPFDDGSSKVIGRQQDARIQEDPPLGPPNHAIVYKGPRPWLKYFLIFILILVVGAVLIWKLHK